MSAPVAGPKGGRRFSHLSDTQLTLLDNKIRNREEKAALINRNVLKAERTAGRLQAVQEEVEQNLKKERLARLLMNRETMEDIRRRNILRDSATAPSLHQQQEALKFSQTKSNLNSLLQRRPSRFFLQERNVLKGEPSAAPKLASAQAELERKQDMDRLTKKLLNRPSREELVKKAILTGDEKSFALDADQSEVLTAVFRYYTSYADPLNIETLGHAKFYKFCRDCRVIGGACTYADIDILFKEVVGASASYQVLNYDQFHVALGFLAHKFYPSDAPVVSFQRFFLSNILPYASKQTPDTMADRLLDPEIMMLFDQLRKPLRQVFTFFAGYQVELRKPKAGSVAAIAASHSHGHELSEAQRAAEVRRAVNCLSFKQLMSLCKVFGFFPDMISKPDLSRVFVASSLSNANDELTYPEFLEALGRIAIIALSKHPYDVKYPEVREKIEALLTRPSLMDLNNAKTLAEKLRGERSFC